MGSLLSSSWWRWWSPSLLSPLFAGLSKYSLIHMLLLNSFSYLWSLLLFFVLHMFLSLYIHDDDGHGRCAAAQVKDKVEKKMLCSSLLSHALVAHLKTRISDFTLCRHLLCSSSSCCFETILPDPSSTCSWTKYTSVNTRQLQGQTKNIHMHTYIMLADTHTYTCSFITHFAFYYDQG